MLFLITNLLVQGYCFNCCGAYSRIQGCL